MPVRMPLRGGVDRRRRAGRAAADDEHVERLLRRRARRRCAAAAPTSRRSTICSSVIRPVSNSSPSRNTVGTDITPRRLGLVAEQRPVDGHVGDVRVEDAHQVERLDHVGAVLAAERQVRLEVVLPVEVAGSGSSSSGAAVDGCPPTWRRASTSDVNSWPIGIAAKRTSTSVPARRMANDGRRSSSPSTADGDLVGQRGDLVEQPGQLGRRRPVVEAGDQLDGAGDPASGSRAAARSDRRRARRSQILPTRSSDGARVLVALLPLRRADLARVGADVLGRLDLAEQLDGVAPDALGGDLDELDDAVGVDEERRPVGQARRPRASRRSRW